MPVTYAERPPALDGCWQTWADQDQPQTIRTQTESGDVKVRRRTTGLARLAEASVTLPASLYADFVDWFRIDCQAGILPTNIVEPSGVESVWRFVEPPQIEWIDPNAFRAGVTLEKRPGWQDIP